VAYNSLASLKFAQGLVRQADELYVEALAEVERFDLVERVQYFTAQRASTAFNLGRWPRAEELIDYYFALPADAPNRPAEWVVGVVRTKIAAARGDDVDALAHSEQNVALARGLNQYA
jgi:hypothetical protein